MFTLGSLVRILTGLTCLVAVIVFAVLLILPVIPPSSPIWDGIRVGRGYSVNGFRIGLAFDYFGDAQELMLIIVASLLNFSFAEAILCSLIGLVGVTHARKLWRNGRQHRHASDMVQKLQKQAEATNEEYNHILYCLMKSTHRSVKPFRRNRRVLIRPKHRRTGKNRSKVRRHVGHGHLPACNEAGFVSNPCADDSKQDVNNRKLCSDDTSTSGYSSDDTRGEAIIRFPDDRVEEEVLRMPFQPASSESDRNSFSDTPASVFIQPLQSPKALLLSAVGERDGRTTKAQGAKEKTNWLREPAVASPAQIFDCSPLRHIPPTSKEFQNLYRLSIGTETVRSTARTWDDLSNEKDNHKRVSGHNQLLERIGLYKKSIVDCVRKAMALRKVFKGMSTDRSHGIYHCYDCCTSRHALPEHSTTSLVRLHGDLASRTGLLREGDGFPSSCPIVQQINGMYSALNMTEYVTLDVKLARISKLQKKLQQDLFRRPYLNDGRLST